MTEAQLQRAVIELTRWLGLLHFHDNDSRRNRAGFPDLVIAGQGGHMFRELKAAEGQLRPEQADWISRLTQGGADVAVWRPVDLASGRVQRELTALTGRAATSPAFDEPDHMCPNCQTPWKCNGPHEAGGSA